MQLRDFIKDTLYEISLGVQLAQAKSRELAAISPASLDGQNLTEKTYVDFDVSIVVTESSEKDLAGRGKVGGEIKIASIAKISAEVGSDASSKSGNSREQTHRVAFKVPIYMNANFRNNPETAQYAADILAQHEPT